MPLNKLVVIDFPLGIIRVFPLNLFLYISILSEDEMKAQGLPQLEAVFITVDPDRDTPEIMKNYLKGMAILLMVLQFFCLLCCAYNIIRG